MEDIVIIGAGPCGLSTAIEAKKRGLNPVVIEKGSVVNSIYYFPTMMQFFSTPDLLEIGGLPFVTSGEKPMRHEALKYYRAVVQAYQLNVHTYEEVTRVDRSGDEFTVDTRRKDGNRRYQTRRLVLATGYYDSPNRLNVPGEDLDKVHHYYKEGHPYNGLKVLVIGGKNSAVDAAMDLYNAGAEVSMAYRREAFTKSVKAWVKPVIESAIQKGWIDMYWNTQVKEIAEDHVVLEQEGRTFTLENDAVFAMTGYRPNTNRLTQLGVSLNDETGAPVHDPDTMETEVPGLYIAGVIAAGRDANSIFIENGRFHGEKIAAHIEKTMKAPAE
ncbi:YpdA family putative bacillithiol disulfide reductase [Paludifilum halophilum]|uniref:Uncharacterized protein n=1 Tax=Paludifilum halophilum TaxID=1642702 RepID=A0A235BBQ9_9BACL|nr:YpdA family putative bacillithiol disulfide reductase [Paludifilum halophilum]OYD09741.1 hypothetical protein CHM34_01725 [Paludifilum halophilum]